MVAKQDNKTHVPHLNMKLISTFIVACTILLLDTVTPRGLAIWIFQVALVWAATLWATQRPQIIMVAIICAVFIVLDLWLSPHTAPITWINITNQVLGIGAVVGLAQSCLNRLAVEEAGLKTAQELEKSQETVRTLSGLLPICAWCKKIRNEAGTWEPLEVYIHNHSNAEFTHGMCPGCSNSMKSDEKI